VAELPRGEQVADAATAAAWRTRGATLTSALQLGVAEGACELATAYAKERRQFGKPIGQFQAIKHLCADMVSRVEVCRAAVYMAGVCLDAPDVGDPGRAASVARILADRASSENGKDCVQVHGGMGYTWEVDAHLFVKRAWALATAFGSSDEHAESLAMSV
jgi:alkylation response protein AidB-like acyl-CoA dehydrogenase